MRARAEREVWPADQVERWPIAKLIPYARNARTHSPEQVAQIAASIREFGFTVPVLVDEQGTLIAGHGRVLAAQQLGITDVDDGRARMVAGANQAYRLADNQLALNAGWDRELLGLEPGELKLGGFEIGAPHATAPSDQSRNSKAALFLFLHRTTLGGVTGRSASGRGSRPGRGRAAR